MVKNNIKNKCILTVVIAFRKTIPNYYAMSGVSFLYDVAEHNEHDYRCNGSIRNVNKKILIVYERDGYLWMEC